MVARKHAGRVFVGGMVAALCVLLVGALVVLPGCGGDEVVGAAGVGPADVDLGGGAAVEISLVGEKGAQVVSWDSGEVTGAVPPMEVHRYKFHTHQGFFYTVELSSREGDGSVDGGDDSDLYIGREARMDVNDPGTYWRAQGNGGLVPDLIVFKSAHEHAMYVTVYGSSVAVGTDCDYRLRVDRSTAVQDWDLGDGGAPPV